MNTIRVKGVPATVTRESILQFFNVRDSEISLARSTTKGDSKFNLTVTFPSESRAESFLQESKPEIDGVRIGTIDKDFLGLTVLSSHNNDNVDIIAIHGLNGHAFKTWATTEAMWLRDFLPSVLENTRIMTFGYDSGLRSQNTVADIRDFAKDLLSQLNAKRRSNIEKQRPLIFICHSLGGIVAKQALCIAINEDRFHSISKSTFGILFFGTPHRGSETAEYGMLLGLVAKAVGLREDLVEDLKRNSGLLSTLANDFRRCHKESNLYVSTFYETREMIVKKGISNRFQATVVERVIVPKESALLDLGIEEQNPMNKDHSTVCKFSEDEESDYLKALDALERLVSIAPEVIQRRFVEGTSESMELNFKIPFRIPYLRYKNFVGRDQELLKIRTRLQRQNGTENSRTIFYGLIGTGGMGKTQIAIEYAYQYHQDYSAVFWVNGASEMDTNATFKSIAEVIVKEQAKQMITPNYSEIARKLDFVGVLNEDGRFSNHVNDIEEINTAIKNWLSLPQNTTWLLIFDNVDDLESFRIDRFFPTCNGNIIITSRRRDISRFAQSDYIEGLDPDAADELLLRLAGMERTAQGLTDARKVTEYLGYMPLAIEHAAAFVKNMNVPLLEYMKYYEKAFQKVHEEIPLIGWNYRDETAATTWEVSFNAIKTKCPAAAEILLMCSFINNQDISEELFCSNNANLEEKLDVKRRIRHLTSFSLAKGTCPGHINVHPVVHSWARERLTHLERVTMLQRLVNGISNTLSSSKLNPACKEWDHDIERRLFRHLSVFGRYLAEQIFQPTDGCNERMREVIQEMMKNVALIDTVHNMAGVYYNQGRYDEALEWYGRALAGREKALGKDHPSTLSTVNNMAGVFYKQGRYDEALEWYGRALAGSEKALGKDHPSTLSTVNNMALVFYKQGRYDEALEWYGRALAGSEKALGKDHPSTLSMVNNMASVFYNQGRYDEALEWYGRALAGKEKTLGKDHPSTLSTVNNMASVFYNQGRYDEALEWYGRALAGREKALGKDHPSTLRTAYKMARLQARLKGVTNTSS